MGTRAQNPKKNVYVAAGLAMLGVAVGLVVFVGLRHSQTAHASPAPGLLSALPPGAPTILYIDLSAVRASSFYQHRPDKGPITVPDGSYAEFMGSTGFDFEKDLDRVAMASWAASPGKETNTKRMVVVAEGRFDHAKIRSYAARKGKIDHQEGHEVFLFPKDDKSGWNSVTFLDEHRVAIVEGESMAWLFASHHSESTGAPVGALDADPARARAGRLDGSAAFLITRVPPIPDNSALSMQNGKNGQMGIPQSAQLMKLARSVQWITLAALPDGDNLRVSLEGECSTATDARQIQAMLELLRVFGRAALESPKTRDSTDPATLAAVESLLTSAQVDATAERVRILFEVTPDILHLREGNKSK